jgi:hypothetical protein
LNENKTDDGEDEKKLSHFSSVALVNLWLKGAGSKAMRVLNTGRTLDLSFRKSKNATLCFVTAAAA